MIGFLRQQLFYKIISVLSVVFLIGLIAASGELFFELEQKSSCRRKKCASNMH